MGDELSEGGALAVVELQALAEEVYERQREAILDVFGVEQYFTYL